MTHCLVNHHITGHLVFVLVCTELFMMCPAIDSPTSCEIRAFIRFHHDRSMSAVEIRLELCVVCSQTVMSEEIIRMFKGWQTNIHDEERNGRPAICSE
jgi:hypothetical protein